MWESCTLVKFHIEFYHLRLSRIILLFVFTEPLIVLKKVLVIAICKNIISLHFLRSYLLKLFLWTSNSLLNFRLIADSAVLLREMLFLFFTNHRLHGCLVFDGMHCIWIRPKQLAHTFEVWHIFVGYGFIQSIYADIGELIVTWSTAWRGRRIITNFLRRCFDFDFDLFFIDLNVVLISIPIVHLHNHRDWATVYSWYRTWSMNLSREHRMLTTWCLKRGDLE